MFSLKSINNMQQASFEDYDYMMGTRLASDILLGHVFLPVII